MDSKTLPLAPYYLGVAVGGILELRLIFYISLKKGIKGLVACFLSSLSQKSQLHLCAMKNSHVNEEL